MQVTVSDLMVKDVASEGVNCVCPLLVTEQAGIRRTHEPVAAGVPFPQGALKDVSHVMLCDPQGRSVPVQTQVLSRWADNSVQWVLVDFFANLEPGERGEYQLRILPASSKEHGSNTLSIKKLEHGYAVDTGLIRYVLNPGILAPFESVQISGQPVIETKESSVVLTDNQGELFQPHIEDLTVEAIGPVRATVILSGKFTNGKSTPANFLARLSFYAGSGLVAFAFTIHNPRAAHHPGGLWDLGDEGSLYFEDLSWNIPLALTEVAWNTQPLKPLQTNKGQTFEIYQDSSGGLNWNSSNHVNKHGEVKHQFPGYRVMSDGIMMEEGKRATPSVMVTNQSMSLRTAIENFWQNFPKAFDVNENQLSVRLFPHQYDDVYELQGGEQKTHTVFLEFSKVGNPNNSFDWVHHRLLPQSTPEWYSQSNAVSYCTPRAMDQNDQYIQCIDSIVRGEESFFDRREIIDEYGWRNFGELYADHEAVGTGDDSPPRVSHYNNQYDPVCGALIEFMRTGNAQWLELGRDLARHVIDIDIYHTKEDSPAYNGGLFWHTDHYFDATTVTHRSYSRHNIDPEHPNGYGGGPSNEQNYTSGLLQYYFLTGDPWARETVQGLAEWVINMDQPRGGILGMIDRRPRGLASATVSRDYHGPGRGGGNSINALLDAYRLSNDRRYVDKAEVLIRRCIHPEDSIEERNLCDIEYRWSYTVFLRVLGKYLDFKIEIDGTDWMYEYARASLLHYVEWMAEHEVPYKQVLNKVQIPTETWPAQDIWKSIVFLFAAKYEQGLNRTRYLEKAQYYFHRTVTDLLSFETWQLARPLILLLVNGYMHAYFQQGVLPVLSPSPQGLDWGRPKPFTTQLHELYKTKDIGMSWVRTMKSLGQ